MMQDFQPQVQLFVQSNFGEPDVYFLHVLTFCPRTNFCADGHLPIPGQLNEEGVWVIDLKIRQDSALPDLKQMTPVGHTFTLGSLPGDMEDVPVQVNVRVGALSHTRGDDSKPKATSTVSTTSASKPSRPTDDL